jgi:hypothetical protein
VIRNLLTVCSIWKIKDIFSSDGKVIPFGVWEKRRLNSNLHLLRDGIVENIKSKGLDPTGYIDKDNEINGITRL